LDDTRNEARPEAFDNLDPRAKAADDA